MDYNFEEWRGFEGGIWQKEIDGRTKTLNLELSFMNISWADKFYVLCTRLKKLIRTGWKDWNVKRERVESVAEHIYGVQMLALAMYSEYQYDIDIEKVLYMLAVHELEETIIGDLTFLQISSAEVIIYTFSFILYTSLHRSECPTYK